MHLASDREGESAIEPVSAAGLAENAARAAHEHLLKAAPPCTAPVRQIGKRSHLRVKSMAWCT